MGIVLKIKRAETPLCAALKRFALFIDFDLSFLRWWGIFLRAIHVSVKFVIGCFRKLLAVVYYGPILKRNLYLELVPAINGNVQIFVDNRACISGAMAIGSGHVIDKPELPVGNRSDWRDILGKNG
jgi:hypothetical protein